MNTDTRNQIEDSRAALWTVVAIIGIAIIAYAGYAAYHRPENYGMQPGITHTQIVPPAAMRPAAPAPNTGTPR